MLIWTTRHLSRQAHGKKVDINNDGMIDKTVFKGRVVAMLEKMDCNGDGSLDDKEINKMTRYHYGKM